MTLNYNSRVSCLFSLIVQDFPPADDFRKLCPQQNKDFYKSLPFEAYTSEDGFFNLVAHYAMDIDKERAFKPDLGMSRRHLFSIFVMNGCYFPNTGPKMYFATADKGHVGSTRLHRDCTSAANILLFATNAAPYSTEPKIGANWTIFKREDTENIRLYLSETYPDIASEYLLSHEVFVTLEDCRKLATRGVHAFRFTQEVGDVVFINAGCLHQVKLSHI